MGIPCKIFQKNNLETGIIRAFYLYILEHLKLEVCDKHHINTDWFMYDIWRSCWFLMDGGFD